MRVCVASCVTKSGRGAKARAPRVFPAYIIMLKLEDSQLMFLFYYWEELYEHFDSSRRVGANVSIYIHRRWDPLEHSKRGALGDEKVMHGHTFVDIWNSSPRGLPPYFTTKTNV